ncbi:hypothetical protein [Candidatus Magnetobacterium casense]|uniref:Uncharacterized protein n=1 Tax=Candidatus Magnetobacterium casense TaxID=1455061 RepID=A0ABS6S466_9BACT|nr:hypothetical protein [Candidatus Magnetobacterium casensis]MBV6343650.1 hypothetical protein [Candidatus Magnetobacterium casensis]
MGEFVNEKLELCGVCCQMCTKFETEDCLVVTAWPWSKSGNWCSAYVPSTVLYPDAVTIEQAVLRDAAQSEDTENGQITIKILHDEDGECSSSCDLWVLNDEDCKCDLMDEKTTDGIVWSIVPTRCPGPGTYKLVRVEDVEGPTP